MRLPEEVYRAEAKGTPRADEELTREERRRRRAKKKRSHKSRTAQQARPKLWLCPYFKRLLGDCMPLSSSSSTFGQSNAGLRRGCQQHYERMQKARKAAIDGCSSVLMIVGSKCFLIAANLHVLRCLDDPCRLKTRRRGLSRRAGPPRCPVANRRRPRRRLRRLQRRRRSARAGAATPRPARIWAGRRGSSSALQLCLGRCRISARPRRPARSRARSSRLALAQLPRPSSCRGVLS